MNKLSQGARYNVFLHKMLVRMVAHDDIVDLEIWYVNNIVSEFCEEEHVMEDPSCNIGDAEDISVRAAVTGG